MSVSGRNTRQPSKAFDWVRVRDLIFIYTLLWFVFLFVVGGFYFERPELAKQWVAQPWQLAAAHSLWFGMLGGVSISLKGVYDHWSAAEWEGGRWTKWYLGRPISGAIVGAVTYAVLQVANPTSSPSLAAISVAAFILGSQERRFVAFLAEVGKLILTVPNDTPTGFSFSSLSPSKGAAGSTLVIQGTGMLPGLAVTVNNTAATEVQVSSDGTSAACILPAGPAGGGKVPVVIANPDGTAKVLKDGFEYG